MCGRYGFIHSPEALQQAWGRLHILGDFTPSYNRAPGQMHPVVRQAPERLLGHQPWDLLVRYIVAQITQSSWLPDEAIPALAGP